MVTKMPQIVTNTVSATPLSCHQHILSATSVTYMDVYLACIRYIFLSVNEVGVTTKINFSKPNGRFT